VREPNKEVIRLIWWNELDALLQNILTSSTIEGEQLNVGSVRSSLARRMGLEAMEDGQVSGGGCGRKYALKSISVTCIFISLLTSAP